MLSAEYRYQFFGTLCANLICVAYGTVCGWPAGAFPVLQSNGTPLPSGPLTLDDLSWVGSNMCIGSIFGVIYYGWAMDRFGRKNALIQSAIPNLIGWAIMFIAQNAMYLNVSRFLSGFAGGGCFVVIPIYVAEIADVKVRGALGSLMVFTCNIGVLIAFVVGYYFDYTTLPLIYIAFPIAFLGVFVFFPETPVYLLKNGQFEEAEKSLQFYRNIPSESVDESSGPMLKKEMYELQKTYQPDVKSDVVESSVLDEFKGRHGRRAMVMAFILIAVSQMCGLFVMLNYTANIFIEAGSKMDTNLAAIIMGVVQILGDYTTTMLVERTGRKFLFIFSCAGNFLALSGLAVFIHLFQHNYDVQSMTWVPVVCFAVAVFMGNCGLLTLPFLIVSEILPDKIRSIGSLFSMVHLYVVGFLLLKMFPLMLEMLGMPGSILSFALVSLVGGVYVLAVVPETKGKSFDDIKRIIEK